MSGVQGASGSASGADFDPVASLMKALDNAISRQKSTDEAASTEGSGGQATSRTDSASAQQFIDKIISRLTQAYDTGGSSERLSLQA
jgi:hypothetical protein